MNVIDSEKCLALLHQGANEMRRGNLAAADQLFAAVIEAARSLPKEQAYAIFPLAVADLSLLRSRQGKTEEAAKLRDVAITTLDAIGTPPQHGGFLSLMGTALMDLQEFRRAVPFLESSAQCVSDRGDSLGVAALLSRAGQCYCRAGLHDHGAIPLRAAVKIFRDHPGDPRMPDALLNLGNALRKSSPAEAERFYKEAAAWYEAKLQFESAAPAWINLGILCSEQGRHAEARTLFERLLGIANDVGMLSEEYDPTLKRQVGNVPQTLSHASLVNAAARLAGVS